MSNRFSDQIKGQFVRHFESIDQSLEYLDAEITLKSLRRQLQLSSVTEVQHQAKDLIVYLATYTQLPLETGGNYD